MSSFQPILITGYNSGLVKNKKPFQILDDSFQELNNCYVWRETVKKREGIKFLGRLRRCFTTDVTLSTQANGATYINLDILDDPSFNLKSTEPNAEIEPGSLQVTVGAIVLTEQDPADGTLSDGGTNTGIINYSTGRLELNFTPPLGVATNVDVQFCYFPALPAMGIDLRELTTINDEQTVLFDTKYVYLWDGNHFNSPTTTTWSGSDSDFFWMSNYRGVTADSRLLFVTNFTNPADNTNNRIRYTPDVVNWTDFTPAVAGTTVTNYNLGQVVTPFTSFGPAFLPLPLPIIPGTVTITLKNPTDPAIGFRDRLTTYPNGDLIGSPSANTGTINYQTGQIDLTNLTGLTQDTDVLVTFQYESSFLFQAKIIIPYYGRLLALNVYEGADSGTTAKFYNRCRFSQVGDPTQQDAWISTTPGKGGFIDAPINEEIVSARFYKNTLIVFFERSTWQLRYVGDVGLPFLWERLSSDFGSESTFSTVLFDDGVLAVGDKAIVASSGSDVQRIDLQIPDQVFSFKNVLRGKERVHGKRDFFKELVYWTYTFNGDDDQKYPNRVLLYNYRNNTYAVFRDNVTVFGELQTQNGVSWDLPIPWDDDISWDTEYPKQFGAIISGNHQGWIHWYQYPDTEDIKDSLTNMNDQESLSIKSILLSQTNDIVIQVVNHNLKQNEIIYITGLLFIDITGDPVQTDLNNRFYQVTKVNADILSLKVWNFDTQQYTSSSFNSLGYAPDPSNNDTYVGNGRVALVQNISIYTKDFNPFANNGSMMKMSYADFQTDATPNSSVSVDLVIDSSDSINTRGNLLVGNREVETSINQIGSVTDITQANPGIVTAENHGLRTGQKVTFRNVQGMTEVNGVIFTVNYVSDDSFSIGDTSGFTPYLAGTTAEWFSQDYLFYTPGSNYAWHRFYATCYGQYIAFKLFYDNNLMNTIDTHQQKFELNAMQLFVKQAGRLPF
jgi:hypothetical protein